MPPKNKPVTAAEVQHLEKAMGSFTLKDDLILRDAVPRPGYGTLGQKIPVEANMFKARFNGAPTIYHYDVEIVPVAKVANQKMPKELASKIFMAAKQAGTRGPDSQAFAHAAFDNQKNAYTTTQFSAENGVRRIRVELPEAGREITDKRRFDVNFRLANTIDLEAITRFCSQNKQSTQEGSMVATALQAVSVMLREEPSKKYKALGARGRFYGLANAQELPGGAQVLSGFHQSFRHTSMALPAIQVDTAYTAVWKSGNLANNVGEYLGLGGGGGGGGARGGRGGFRGGRGGGRGGAPGGGHPASVNELDQRQTRTLKKLLYGSKFTLPYKKNDRVYTVKGISTLPASEIKFMMQGKDGQPDQQIGLVQYYKQHLGINLSKPRLPCIIYGKNFMAPFEVVQISDFNPVPFAAMSSDQTAAMIKVAAARPGDRAASIKHWRRQLAYENSPLLKAWGLQVHPDMLQLEARVLPGPRILYKGNKSVNLWNGGWNLKGNHGPPMTFTRPGNPLKSWAILSLAPRLQLTFIQNFTQQLVKALQSYGVNVANPQPELIPLTRMTGSSNGEVHDSLTAAARACFMKHKMAPQLIVVILPFKDGAMYKEVKTVASMRLKEPVITQCLVADKLMNERGLDQYLGNVSMKIQGKLGGVTHEVNVPGVDATTMIMGADVTHPGGGLGRTNPSIAVTVGAMSGDNMKYETDCRLQDPRQEVIGDLKGMTKNLIETWAKNNKGTPPAKIIFFRDGVSDGQWQIVKDVEAQAIRAAAGEFKPGYKPKLTFVICAKRHNMRFFGIPGKTPQQHIDNKNGNLPPGTVVDKDVTHPFVFDFYLQAHHGLQGTARPTHYIVIEDDNKFTADQMQVMCFQLCSTYQRATRSVSIVPPAYYAHNAAELIRLAVYTDDSSDVATSLSGHSGAAPTPMATFPQTFSQRYRANGTAKLGWYM